MGCGMVGGTSGTPGAPPLGGPSSVPGQGPVVTPDVPKFHLPDPSQGTQVHPLGGSSATTAVAGVAGLPQRDQIIGMLRDIVSALSALAAKLSATTQGGGPVQQGGGVVQQSSCPMQGDPTQVGQVGQNGGPGTTNDLRNPRSNIDAAAYRSLLAAQPAAVRAKNIKQIKGQVLDRFDALKAWKTQLDTAQAALDARRAAATAATSPTELDRLAADYRRLNAVRAAQVSSLAQTQALVAVVTAFGG